MLLSIDPHLLFWQFITFGFGTVLIRGLHVVRRRIAGPNRYFSFADFLSEERTIQTGGFVAIALPPLIGGALLFVVPGGQAVTAAAAGFLAAFLGVWPIFQFPYQILDAYMLPHWPKLRFLYVVFVVASSALAYSGFLGVAWLVAIAAHTLGTARWGDVTTGLLTNALYDLVKAPLLLGLGLLSVRYANRQRQVLGRQAQNAALNAGPSAGEYDG